ncbi:hypothetical protein W97_00860 [Coniosporium apollinis CBS 100218]|uniref:Spindle pole body component n=1 Tax=Coniosporium apollinis (strain CBS 100218) TaxID=1168221 RepID=R7YIN7_CONA1|nr:uncharacterized protein W97_00860 [Coniosporium apollinis CBS 100218]EON61644.1 hypothetical protein W97_00860 [Coniosporium apollinis CBS 100218]
MTSNPNVRITGTAERKTSASTHASSRPRVPSSIVGGEQSRKQSATESLRRKETRDVLTRETITSRTASPLKRTSESRVNAGRRGKEDGKAPKAGATASAASTGAKKDDSHETPWSPQASLVPHTTAPLASRVSIPPPAATAPQGLQPQPLHELSLDAQEAAIIEDLLFVFMGFEGQYIRFVDTYNALEEKDRLIGPSFRIMPGLDPSLRDLTTSMLKMATHYVAVEAFVEVQSRDEYGAVNHALCAAVRKLLKDYLILMAQLEHQMLTNETFTLHVLNLHTKPTSHMLFQLYTLGIEVLKANSVLDDDKDDSLDDTDNLEDILESLKEGANLDAIPGKKTCKGGQVLSLVTKRLASMSGDPAARQLLTNLLKEASRPYMTMLNEWLHHGGIKDPHAEFLIKEQKSIKREDLGKDYTDQYWDKRYSVRDNLVPPQLEGVKDKVLLAGKYLNVVRECGGVDISNVVQDVPTTFDDPRFLENVNEAYTYANSALLDLLLTTHALPARLRSLKHYFFLDRSDFFTYFLELGNSELKKPAKQVNLGKLQSLLDIVLRQPGSVAAEDPYKEDVKVDMIEISLANWLMMIVNVRGMDQESASGSIVSYTPATQSSSINDDKDLVGFDALVLDCEIPFPVSLVVSRVTITRYQLLFRFLLSLRHLETLLISTWTDHSNGFAWKHQSKNPKIEQWKRRCWTLRARMLVFVQQLLYYCTAEVVEPNWQALMTRLVSGKPPDAAENGPAQVKRTVDEVMQDHIDFLATCMKECMLTNSKLLRINSKIIATCTMFSNFQASLARHLIRADQDLVTIAIAKGTKASHPSASAPLEYDPAHVSKLFDILGKYEENFTRHLKVLLDTLNYLAATETVVFLSLCARLSTAQDGAGAGPGESVYA